MKNNSKSLLFSVLVLCGLAGLSGCGDSPSEDKEQNSNLPEQGLELTFKPAEGTPLAFGDTLEIVVDSNPALRDFEITDHPSLDCQPVSALGNFRRKVSCKVRETRLKSIQVVVRAQNRDEEKTWNSLYPVKQV